MALLTTFPGWLLYLEPINGWLVGCGYFVENKKLDLRPQGFASFLLISCKINLDRGLKMFIEPIWYWLVKSAEARVRLWPCDALSYSYCVVLSCLRRGGFHQRVRGFAALQRRPSCLGCIGRTGLLSGPGRKGWTPRSRFELGRHPDSSPAHASIFRSLTWYNNLGDCR